MSRKHLAIFLCFFSTIAVATVFPSSQPSFGFSVLKDWKAAVIEPVLRTLLGYEYKEGDETKRVPGVFNLSSQAGVKEIAVFSVQVSLVAGFLIGMISAFEKSIQGGLSSGLNKMPHVFNSLKRFVGNNLNKFCNRPNPLTASDVQIWEQMVDGVTNALCEQSSSGNLMLRNIRVGEEAEEQATDINWSYFIEMIDSMFGHIGTCLHERLPYYQGGQEQAQWLVSAVDSFSTTDKAGIAFMIKTIMSNLQHISLVCKKAESIDELDKSHVKKIARTTLLLFRKLRVMLDGESKKHGTSTTPSIPQPYPGMSGSGGMLNY